MSIGHKTVVGEELRSFVDRVEAIDAKQKDLQKDRALIMAEAKARGFVPAGIRYVVKVRAMKPHDRVEAEALRDQYMHALGLDQEPPLFRALALIDVDIHTRESVIDAMKKFAPADGEIVVKVGKTAERIWRDKDGNVQSEPVVDLPPRQPVAAGEPAKPREKPPVPDVDEAGAEELGRQAARENRPVIDNPFPFGDPRRARFDLGWRRETGGDGMGPDD